MLVWFAAVALTAIPAFGQANRREPYIGYAYPAGGQPGTTFQILIGGQNLQRVSQVHVSGDGVRATVIQPYRPLMNLDAEQRQLLQGRLRELFEARLAELPSEARERIVRSRAFAGLERGSGRTRPASTKAADDDGVRLPEHPLLRDLESRNLRDLVHLRDELADYRKRQPSVQIGESVLINVTIDARATIGDRDLRLGTPQELTNPLRFQVGALREVREQEPNDPGAYPFLPPDPPLELPILVNGQIKQGDVDRLRFQARQGQTLVIKARARHLIPYLADAVPGWFQTTLALYAPDGQELAFADDYRFDPDPVLYYEVPEDGLYEVEIRDALYRGRDDFVYRLTISEQPFITQLFPLGGRGGSRTVAEIDGWNLDSSQLPLATPPGIPGVRQAALRGPQQASDPVDYAVDLLPECVEIEPNDTRETAQPIELPHIVNGRISPPGDADLFSFKGSAGQTVVAAVHARRLASPLDSLVQLIDPSGRVVGWNDDHEDVTSGLLTHHADSYLRSRLTESGTYCVRLIDAAQQGGEDFAYRLRISGPRPDFALRATPSSITVPAGWSVPIRVYALRRDGFDGPIDVVLKEGSRGFALSGGRIPPGQDRIDMTVTATGGRGSGGPASLQLEGRALLAGRTIRRPVVPADDMMQAFAYRHLVPSQEMVALVVGARRPAPPLTPDLRRPVRLSAGRQAEVLISTGQRAQPRELQFALREPPAGVVLETVRRVPGGYALMLAAGREATTTGFAGNLIIEAYAPGGGGQQAGRPANQNRGTLLGILPAIPFELVQR